MGDLTRNLSRSEFTCKCQKPQEQGYCGGNFVVVDFLLVKVIQGAVDYFERRLGVPVGVTITSGNRCPLHNIDEGGERYSKHQYGIAADHYLFIRSTKKRIDTDALANYYDEMYSECFGLGRYPNGRVHLDVRSERARWDMR